VSKQALIEHRPWLLASIAAAIAFYLLRDTALGGIQLMLLKGCGAALLAVYALRRGVGQDAQLLAGMLALCALGDMLIEIDLMFGGASFFLAHMAGLALFLRNPREEVTGSQKAAGAALLLLTPLLSWLLSGDYNIGIYGLALGGMAGAAWMSRFPRYRVGIGAVLFVISDLLIFSQYGSLDIRPLPELLIWPLYYVGVFLIAAGVVQTLLRDQLETAWQR